MASRIDQLDKQPELGLGQTSSKKPSKGLTTQEAANSGFVDRKAAFVRSPWDSKGEVSQARNTVTGEVKHILNDIMTAEPAFQLKPLPPTFIDRSYFEAHEGYNFGDTATRKDQEHWLDAITEEQGWLNQYNQEMSSSCKTWENITMDELKLPKNKGLRKMIAEFALQDKAEKIHEVSGDRPVHYNDFPVRTPEKKVEAPVAVKPKQPAQPVQLKRTIGQMYVPVESQPATQEQPQTQPAQKASLVTRAVESVKNAGSAVSSAFKSVGKGLSKLKFW